MKSNPNFQNKSITSKVPIIAPTVSKAWCIPKPLPLCFVDCAIITSLGGSLNFPSLSIEINPIIDCHVFAKIRKSLDIIEIEYPPKMNPFLLPILSEMKIFPFFL